MWLAGLYLFLRLVDVEVRHKDTETVGLTYAIVAVVYAAVGTYEAAMDKAADEPNFLGSLAFDSAGLSNELARRVRTDIDTYIDIVTKEESPSQQAYQMGDRHFEPGSGQVHRACTKRKNERHLSALHFAR